MTLNQAWQISGTLIAIVCCVWAWRCGGPAERRGAIYILTAWLLSVAFQSHQASGPGVWVDIIDILLLAALVHLSVQSRKPWTLFAAACQLDTIASHMSQVLSGFSQWAYVVVLGIWGGYGLLICLAIGTYNHQRETRRLRGMAEKPPTASA
ncbi:hypothetical protein [Asticcacaulis benevestitus]|uniref:Uncharacterized protein n=1 Tax=Asticcacaulis benevestitus DSM 16100 = ATCC BAA-896 TaxID=1121022 RepID=V4PBZ1_9CAUL|nr:hypothetical protein [Asticcacaulis benevestitus]ESQ84624.1 hypothetical protein ABENE_19595 [Asticcacaulis benevestitus DSM 16100 = ATCC BAA-896]